MTGQTEYTERELCRINRTAERLDTSRSTIYRMVRDKKLTLVKTGKRASRITEKSIAAFLASQMTIQ